MTRRNTLTDVALPVPFEVLRHALADIRGLLRPDRANARIERAALSAFTIRVASAGLLYLTQVVLARLLGSFEFGIYVFAWTWVLMLGGLSTLGLNTLMIRLLPEYRERGELDRLRGLLRHGRLMAFLTSSGLAIAGLAAIELCDGLVSQHAVLPVLLALVCLPMITLTDVQDSIGRSQRWMGAGLIPPYLLRPLLLLFAIVAAYGSGLPLTASTAAGAAIVATWIAAAVQFALLARRFARELPPGPVRAERGRWLAASLPLLAIYGAELVLQNADVLVISHFLTPTDVAIYFAAAKTMSLVMFIHYAVGSAVAGKLAGLNAAGNHAGLGRCVRMAVRWTFWPSLAFGLLLLAAGPALLAMFGPQFLSGYPAMAVLVFGFLARAAVGPSEHILNMLGEQKACAGALAATAMLNVVLCCTLIPAYGTNSAALATASALAVGAALNWIIARRRLGLDIGIWAHASRRTAQ